MRGVPRWITGLALLTAIAAVQAIAQPLDPDEAEVHAIEARDAEAVLHGDLETLARLWDADLVVTNPFGEVLGRDEVLARMRAGKIRFAVFRREIERVRVMGDVAVSVGRELLEGAEGSVFPPGERRELRITQVWRRMQGEWRLSVRHASPFPPRPSGPR
jgi:ketosteroid isomerase-like protein